jgi:hypothetical protein
MNSPAIQRAVEAFSRYHDDHPNMTTEQSVPAIRSIMKRFSVASMQELIDATERKLDTCTAELARLRNDDPLATSSNKRAGDEPPNAVEQLMLCALIGDCEGRTPLTKEQREFFSSLPFGYDPKRNQFFIGSIRGKRLTLSCC